MNSSSCRYIFQTTGVCPPEIHFTLTSGIIDQIRFVGGGCPGNARLVERLLAGRTVDQALPFLDGIDCRNGSSCPDQLQAALNAAVQGTLNPAQSFKVFADPYPKSKVAVIGDLGGDAQSLRSILSDGEAKGVEAFYAVGGLSAAGSIDVGDSASEIIKILKQENVTLISNSQDYRTAQNQDDSIDCSPQLRDYLLRLPQVLSFELGNRRGMAFYGEYILNLPGFSDFEPFSLEMNMVCDLTSFMAQEDVFPALEAMTPQFEASAIFFSQPGKWGRWTVGGVDYFSLGPAPSYAIMEARGAEIKFDVAQC